VGQHLTQHTPHPSHIGLIDVYRWCNTALQQPHGRHAQVALGAVPLLPLLLLLRPAAAATARLAAACGRGPTRCCCCWAVWCCACVLIGAAAAGPTVGRDQQQSTRRTRSSIPGASFVPEASSGAATSMAHADGSNAQRIQPGQPPTLLAGGCVPACLKTVA